MGEEPIPPPLTHESKPPLDYQEMPLQRELTCFVQACHDVLDQIKGCIHSQAA